MALGAGGPMATRFSSSVFRATSSDGELVEKAVKEERAAGSKKACVITANTSYYTDINQVIKLAWRKSGGEIAYSEEIDFNDPDIRSIITKIRSRSCDTIFVWTSPSSVLSLLKGFRTQHVFARKVIPWYSDTAEILHETVGGNDVVTLYRYAISDRQFVARYEARFKNAVLRPAANCYDGIRFIAQLAGKVGTEMEKLKGEILSTKDFKGVSGPFIILPNRERTGEKIDRYLLKNGKLELQ
jgi:ABC-type branched-subunit amino acid transport system substrate-binding protein